MEKTFTISVLLAAATAIKLQEKPVCLDVQDLEYVKEICAEAEVIENPETGSVHDCSDAEDIPACTIDSSTDSFNSGEEDGTTIENDNTTVNGGNNGVVDLQALYDAANANHGDDNKSDD